MKKSLLFITLLLFLSNGLSAYFFSASLKSSKNGKIYYFDFVAKKYMRYNASTKKIEGTFDLSNFCNNWDAKVGTIVPSAVFQSPDGSKVYFVDTEHDIYLRHDWANSKIDAGWPKSLSSFDAGWPANWKGSNNKATGGIMRVSQKDLYLFDFYTHKYVVYNWDTDNWSSTADMANLGFNFNQITTNLYSTIAAYYEKDVDVITFSSAKLLAYMQLELVPLGSSSFITAYPLTDFDGWSLDWYESNFQCGSERIQGAGGYTYIPYLPNVPFGKLGVDYSLVDIKLHLTHHANKELNASVLKETNFPLFYFNDLSGANLGTSCNGEMTFKKQGTDATNGNAPYVGKDFVPKVAFNYIENSTNEVRDFWYLELRSNSDANGDYAKKFILDFEPKKELFCGNPQTYTSQAGKGVWDMSSVGCGSPAGKALYYQFTPGKDTYYYLELTNHTSATYYIKEADLGFSSKDWSCMTSAGSNQYQLGNLEAGKKYYILIKPNSTTPLTQTLKIKCPCYLPGGLEETQANYTSLSYHWDTPSSDIKTLSWSLRQGGTSIQSNTFNTSGASNSLTISGLNPGSDYTFSLSAGCTNSGSTGWASVKSHTLACDIPDNLTTSNITASGFVVSMTGGSGTKKWQVVPAGNAMGNGIVAQAEAAGGTFSVTGLTGGNYDFYVQSKCDDAYSDAASLLNISTLTGVNDLNSISDITVFPNPVKDILFVSMTSSRHADLSVSIVNSTGQIMLNKAVSITEHQQVALEVSDLPSGIYYIQILEEDKVAGYTFVKK